MFKLQQVIDRVLNMWLLAKDVQTAISKRKEKTCSVCRVNMVRYAKISLFLSLQNGAFPTTPLLIKGINPFNQGGSTINFIPNFPLNKTGY